MDSDGLAIEFEALRSQLRNYLWRLTVNPGVADELVQTTFVRALEALPQAPLTQERRRFWLFRIATNLAIDERRRHATWRETALQDARRAAENSPQFVELSRTLQGSPETGAIAREHLAVCFACTLRNLAAPQAAALLLKEVHGFTVEEAGELLGATFGQVKNWLQSARSQMEQRYATSCALVNKQGVCYQCVELDQFFNGQSRDPLAGTRADVEARLNLLRESGDRKPNSWHDRLMEIFDAL